MKELSLHILDIAKNSVKAKASLIEIIVTEDEEKNLLSIGINDNGCGMTEEFLARVRDPFSTTRTTRKVGMGIPLFEAASLQCGGEFDITSKEGVGTKVIATFQHNHIDRAPLGDMADTVKTLIWGSPEIDFLYRHIKNGQEFTLDTRELKKVLGGVPLDTPDVLAWIDEYIREGLDGISVS